MLTRKYFGTLIISGLLILYIFVLFSLAQAEVGNSGTIKIPLSTTKILKLDDVMKRVAIGNPGIAEFTIISSKEVLLLGVKVGRTELNIWPENAPPNFIKSYFISVYDDILELKSKLNEIMGAATANAINISIAKETAVIKGVVHSSYESEQVEKIAGIYYSKVLNLMEVKNKPADKVEVSKKMDVVQISAPQVNRNPSDVNVNAVQAPVSNLLSRSSEELLGNTSDILDIKAAAGTKLNAIAYGAGALESETADTVKVPVKFSERESLIGSKVEIKENKKVELVTKVVILQNASLSASSSSTGTASTTAAAGSTSSSATGGPASEIVDIIKAMRSPEGSILTDKRTNALILIDRPEYIKKMEKMIKILDTSSPQVLIEAKIIEVNLKDSMTNTMKWVYDTLYNSPNGLNSMNNKSITFNDKGLTLGLDYGKINSDHFTTQVIPQLNKLHARILASPSTITLNNQEAKFNISEEFPFPRLTQSTNQQGILVSSSSIDKAKSSISLSAIPSINQEGYIKLDVTVDISNYLGTERYANGDTAAKINSRSTKNFVELKNGETLIISGLIYNRVNSNATKVPNISKIPLIGKLFTSKDAENDRKELLIFITTKIVEKDSRQTAAQQEKYPKIVENKFPNAGEQGSISEFLNIHDEEYVKKNVRDDYEIPKANREMLEASKPEAKVIEVPIKAVPVTYIEPKKEETKRLATEKVAAKIEEPAVVCVSKKIVEDTRPVEVPAEVVKPKVAAVKTKAVLVNTKPVLITETAVEKTEAPVENKQAKFIYRDDRTQSMIESIRAKIISKRK